VKGSTLLSFISLHFTLFFVHSLLTSLAPLVPLQLNQIKRNTAQELLLEDYEGSEVKEVNGVELNEKR